MQKLISSSKTTLFSSLSRQRKRITSSPLRYFHPSSCRRCGLFSSLVQDPSPGKNITLDNERLKKALLTLNHRGPDGHGTWISKDGRVGLGHTRLAIIDLVTGDQPLHNLDHTVSAVVNGELYGHDEIRSNLQKKGYHFQTKSDSEIALHLYSEYGISMIDHLRGEFAITLWDEKSQLFYAIRDRYGIKPLFYTFFNGQILFSSEVKAFFEYGVPRRWNRSYFMDGFGFFRGKETLFDGIYQLLPGEYLVATKSGVVETVKYYEPNYADKNVPVDLSEQSQERVIQKVREQLIESVKLRLRADVPIGCYLSGGLDSSSILGIGQGLLKQEKNSRSMTGLCVAFEGEVFDESPFAERMCEKTGANFIKLEINHEMIMEHFEKHIYNLEQPTFNIHSTAKWLLSRLARENNVKVILTGEGADEIFVGYPHYLIDYIRYVNPHFQSIEKLKEVNKIFAVYVPEIDENHPRKLLYEREIGTYTNFIRVAEHNLLAIGEFTKQNPILQCDPDRRYLSRLSPFLKNKMKYSWDALSTSLYFGLTIQLAHYLLTVLGDRTELAHSIEGRPPFLDHKLVDLVNSIPSQLKLQQGREKYLMRQIVKPYITEELYMRQKQPFIGPPTPYGSKMDLFLSNIIRTGVREVSFLNETKIYTWLDKLEQKGTIDEMERKGIDYIKWQLASIVVMQKQFRLE